MQLIDKETVKHLIKRNSPLPPWVIRVVCADIDDLAPVDAKPVIRGKWTSRNPHNIDAGVYCSNCKCDVTTIKSMYYKFCPECGADMRGEKNGTL